MLDLFKKKRIARYLESVNNYVASAFKPETPAPKKEGIKYSFRDEPKDIQYSLRGDPEDVKYSLRGSPKEKDDHDIRYSTRQYSDRRSSKGNIPNRGDSFKASSVRDVLYQSAANPSLIQLGKELDNYLDLSFVDMLTRYINEKGWRDSRVYKAAQIDRRLFSKIMSDRNYKPAKDTALALVIALELSLDQANDLLSRAGYTLSHSSKRDVIIEYFIREEIYNLSDINEILYRLDQKIIGR